MRTLVIGSILLATVAADAKPRHARVAQSERDARDRDDGDDGDDEGDGPEAKAALPIKLDDLIEVAVRLAPDLARAKIDRVAANLDAEGARRDQAWIASSNIEAKRSALAENVEAPPFSVVAQSSIAAGVGLGRNLPTGGNLQLEAGVQNQTVEYNIVSRLHQTLEQTQANAPAGTDANGNAYDLMYRNTASLRATLKQPLSRGFGPAVALANEKRADLQATEATVKAQLTAEEMVRDLVIAYWDLALTSYTLDVRNQSLELAKKQDDLTHEQMRAGSVPSTALNAVTYEIQIRQEAALRAQLDLEQKSLDVRMKAGLELGRRDVLVRPAEAFDIGEDEFDVEEMLERSHAANRKLATIQLQQKIADVELDVAESQTKPALDMTFSGAVMGDGDNAGTAIGAIGDSYEVSVGLSLQFELSGAAKKSRDAARARKRRLDVDREDLMRQIDTQVVGAVHQVTAARTRVALADKAILVSEENVRAERASFMVGRTTNFQVMQRQSELIEARLRRGQAVADYHKAVAQLQFLSGDILPQYRVNVRSKK
jgi:outer membrane protein TolC